MLRIVKLWQVAGRDLKFLWFALRHPDRPLWLWPAAVLLGWYALEPLNFVFPIVGLVDDFLLLPLILHSLLKLLPTRMRAEFGGGSLVS